MGAGQKQDHWIQDGSEIYFVAKLQGELCNMNFNITDDVDKKMKPWVKLFNNYDLYTKEDIESDEIKLREYYSKIVNKYLPKELWW